MKNETTLSLRRALRAETHAHKNMPVDIIAGDSAPRITGESYYWTTPSGKTRISYPSAYRWPKWYHASTLSIEVGATYAAGLAMHQYATKAVA